MFKFFLNETNGLFSILCFSGYGQPTPYPPGPSQGKTIVSNLFLNFFILTICIYLIKTHWAMLPKQTF